MGKQNELIKKYLQSQSKLQQKEFYKLSTTEKRKYVVENRLLIKIENGKIILDDFQEQILSMPESESRPEEKTSKEDPPDTDTENNKELRDEDVNSSENVSPVAD